jgi:hypothetical protein
VVRFLLHHEWAQALTSSKASQLTAFRAAADRRSGTRRSWPNSERIGRDLCCPCRRRGRSIGRRHLLLEIAAFRPKMPTDGAGGIERTRSQAVRIPALWIFGEARRTAVSMRRLAKVGVASQWSAWTYNIQHWTRLRWRPQSAARLAVA